MKLITAMVRRKQVHKVTETLSEAGYNACTRWSVLGRGKQKGIVVGDISYEELPKEMIYLVVPDEDKGKVIELILASGKVGEKGNPGDGKIFVTHVEEEYNIGSQN